MACLSSQQQSVNPALNTLEAGSAVDEVVKNVGRQLRLLRSLCVMTLTELA